MPGVLHRTLIIRLSSVGDIVLSSPLVRSLRGRYADCQIDFLVKSEYADLVRFNPHVSRVLEFPDRGTLGDLIRQRHAVASSGYDLVIDIHDSIRSRFLSAGARRVTRLNKRRVARALLIEFKVDLYHLFGGAPGVAERYLESVRSFGVADDGKGPELFVPDAISAAVRALLAGEHIPQGAACVGVCPSARHGNKMWPAERFAEAAGRIATRSEHPVLLFGSADERDRCGAIAGMIATSFPGLHTINLAGRTSLLETAAAMDHCEVVLTNDTGLMHIASARGVKVVAIFGPTVRQFGFFPMGHNCTVVEHPGLPCRPCTHIGLPCCPEGHFKCMNEITVDTVTAAAEQGEAGA